jgi:hypothetical protein
VHIFRTEGGPEVDAELVGPYVTNVLVTQSSSRELLRRTDKKVLGHVVPQRAGELPIAGDIDRQQGNRSGPSAGAGAKLNLFDE